MRATHILLLGLLGSALLPVTMAGGVRRRLLADPAWRASEGEAADLVGVWKIQAKDSAIFFPGLAWTAFEKLGDKVKPEDVWAAAANLESARDDIEEQAETDPVRKDVKSPNMEIVVVGSNVTTGMWGGMVVFRNDAKVLGVQPMYGFISRTTVGDIRLQGTDGTPYVAVDMYYHPETKLMEVYVNNMLISNASKGDVNTAYLASSVFKKDEGAIEQALKDIGAWHAAIKKKKAEGGDN